MSSQPWNQNLLLYVVSRNLASTSLRLLFPLCAVGSPGGLLSFDWIGLSVVGEMNESWRNLGFLGRCKWWTHFFPHQIDHVDVFEYLPVNSDNTGLKRRCPVLFWLERWRLTTFLCWFADLRDQTLQNESWRRGPCWGSKGTTCRQAEPSASWPLELTVGSKQALNGPWWIQDWERIWPEPCVQQGLHRLMAAWFQFGSVL